MSSIGITRPIELIYNFVYPKVFAPRRRGTLRLAPPQTRIIMHASNFRPVKNIPAVIQVFAEVRSRMDAKLVMVGDGPEKAAAEQLARELGVHRDHLVRRNQDMRADMTP